MADQLSSTSDLTFKEAKVLLFERFKSYFDSPEGIPDDPFDLKSAINDDKPGRPREAWHMPEFAKVDDLISEGYDVVGACKYVRHNLPSEIKYIGCDTSFRNIYYEFKRIHERLVRRRAFAYSVLNNNIDKSITQLHRLSKITNVHQEFRYW